jgi:formylglycine-generating enzyme required for sulfatase activity
MHQAWDFCGGCGVKWPDSRSKSLFDKLPRAFWSSTLRVAFSIALIVSAAVSGVATGHAQSRAAPLSRAEESALRPNDSFRECDWCPEMVVVPAGSFIMGSPDDEKARGNNEGPQHWVTFARPFAVGRFAVTFDEWDACVADGGCNGYAPNDGGWGRGRRPVIYVSWNDANLYVAWLSRKTGKTYRLLSEAEREYVTRAGTTTSFWWGASISTRQANYFDDDAFGSGSKGEDRERTLPVDSFQPNPWGLYQVHGNVSEWTQDCYHDGYAGAPLDGSAWTSGDCSRRVVRGGAWIDPPQNLRAASRSSDTATDWDGLEGFRLARALTP